MGYAVAYGLVGLLIGAMVSVASRWLPLRRQGAWPRSLPHLKRLVTTRDAWQRRDAWVILTTGLLYIALWERYGPGLRLVIVSVHTAVFLLIFVIDLAHRWVPNILLMWGALLALTVSVLVKEPTLSSALLGGAVGFAWFYAMALAYPKGLGAGDVKLAGLVGLITGFPGVVTALTLGILLGGLIVGGLLLTRRVHRKTYIPYAPFLVTGAWLNLVFGASLTARYVPW